MLHVERFEALGAHAAAPVKAGGSPARILIVDDEPSVLDFVGRVLREAGYTTAAASDPVAALTLTEGFRPFDLLLTDVMMPQMQGDELARRLRQNEPHLKVLYLTGFSDVLFKEKGTLWEDEAFLDKPTSVNGLLEAVSLLLAGHTHRPPSTR